MCVLAEQVYVHCRASFIVVIRIVVAMKKSARHRRADGGDGEEKGYGKPRENPREKPHTKASA